MTVHRSSRRATAALSATPATPIAQLDAREDLGFRLEIELKDGKAPDSFRVFKAGENTSTKGNYLFTESSQSASLAYQAKRGMKTLVDFEHASRYATFAADPQKAGRAACRVKLECKNGELWATQAKWTKAGREAVESGEQEFFSPVFDYDRETMVIGAVTSIGLTATPALDNLTPLAAKDGPAPESNMEELKKFLADLAKQMALKADASATEVLLSMVALKNEHSRVLDALGAKDVSEAIGKIEGHKANTAAVAELREKAKAQEETAAKLRLGGLLDAACTAKKISPAQRPMLEQKFNEAELKAYLDTIAPGAIGGAAVTPVPGASGAVPVPDGKGGTVEVALKDEDVQVAKLMPQGFATPEKMKELAALKAKGVATKNAE